MVSEGPLRDNNVPTLVSVSQPGQSSPLIYILFLQNPFNITLPSGPRSPNWAFPFRYANQNFVCICHLVHAYYIPAHLILPDLSISTIPG